MAAALPGRARVALTWNGAGLAMLLFGTWYSAASQGNGAAYLFLFVLAGVALVSSVHTWLNLRDWTVTMDKPAPVFVGEEAVCPVEALNSSRRSRHALQVQYAPGSSAFFDEVAAGTAERAELRFPAGGRGLRRIRGVRVLTSYPLGFFKGSRWVKVEQEYLVYPHPAGSETLPPSPGTGLASREGALREGDDFAGMRGYRPGESQRHIDWKAVARGQPLLVKQFAGEQDERLMLDWEALPLSGCEERLSQLALWVIKAERSKCLYGLKLPGVAIAPARGEAHYHRCLGALAVYRQEEAA